MDKIMQELLNVDLDAIESEGNAHRRKEIKRAVGIVAVIVILIVALFAGKNYLDNQTQMSEQYQTFKTAVGVHILPGMRDLSEKFSHIDYEYNEDEETMTVIFSSLNGEEKGVQESANRLSKATYTHRDNNGAFDAYVILYRDAGKKDLLYASCNGEKTDW